MNFIRVFQLFTLIILEICPTTIKAQEGACEIEPFNENKVDVVVYINGGTKYDSIWYERYCSWLAGGFPYDDYTPITVKVGGNVSCDASNKCNCPNEENAILDCETTFEYACIEQILGQGDFKKFLCCLVEFANGSSLPVKDYKTCVNEQSGLAEKISKCMENHGTGGPQETALKNSKEVYDGGVGFGDTTEPFFFYNGIFKKCISDDSPDHWLQKLCLMLKYKIAHPLAQCKVVMGWTEFE